MNRPYRVICHMAMSIDGRAAGHYLSAVEFGPYGKAYEDTLQAYGSDNWICGRITFEQHITLGNSVDQRIRKFRLDKFERIGPDGIRLNYLSE